MVEFVKKMKPKEYDSLTKTQRAWLIVGAVIGFFLQAISCYAFGLIMHNLSHKM